MQVSGLHTKMAAFYFQESLQFTYLTERRCEIRGISRRVAHECILHGQGLTALPGHGVR